MTRSRDSGSTSGGKHTSERTIRPNDGREAVRWECPFCDTSRVIPDDPGADESVLRGRARAALRAHIIASDDDGHGPRHEQPDGFDTGSLDRYLRPVSD